MALKHWVPSTLADKLHDLLVNYGDEAGLEMRDCIVHALADLRHICDEEKLDFGTVDSEAYHQTYLSDLQEIRDRTAEK